MIAASAARTGGTVLTYDGNFNSIDRVGSVVLARPTRPRLSNESAAYDRRCTERPNGQPKVLPYDLE